MVKVQTVLYYIELTMLYLWFFCAFVFVLTWVILSRLLYDVNILLLFLVKQ